MSRIKKLKELRLAHVAACSYDYCPESSEASELKDSHAEFMDIPLTEIVAILDKYEGLSPSNIEGYIMGIIDEL